MTVLKKIILSSLLLNIILTFNIFGDDYFELYQKGLELMEEEKYEKALEKFKKSIVANNSFGYSYMFAGWLLYEKLEKPEEALLYLEKAQILMPQEPIILVYFGLAYSKLEKWELVLDYFQRAIEQYKEIQQDIPDWIYNFIASVYLYNLDPQNLDMAITFLNKTINKVNNQELIQAAFRMLAHAYLLKEDYQKAYDYAELCSEDYWIRQQILDENINTTLHDAVANGNLALAAELVKRGADINYQEDLYGNSCLHLSVIYRNQEMLDFILSLKPDLNLKTKMGYTALMLAVFNNSVEAVRALLEAGAWIDARDNNGFTALMFAAYYNHVAIGKILLGYNLDIFIKTEIWDTAYGIAYDMGYMDFATLFEKQKYSEYYKSYLKVFPIAGIPGIDFWAGSYFDHNPRTSLPETLTLNEMTIILNKVEPEWAYEKEILFEAYEYLNGAYFLKSNLSIHQVITVNVLLMNCGHPDRRFYPEANLDYNGGIQSYDGHPGIDYIIHTFESQDIGIPIVAAADGRVIIVVKGYPDIAQADQSCDNNTVWIDHGYDRYTYYTHLKKDILVEEGQYVYAGQQIGWLGASGKILGAEGIWPHLHFGVYEWREWIDPYTGPGNPGPSRWDTQPNYKEPIHIADYGMCDINQIKEAPLVTPRLHYYRTGDKNRALWILVQNLTQGTEIKWELLDPSGKPAFNRTYMYPEYQMPQFYWRHVDYWPLDNLSLTKGKWTVNIYFDSQLHFQFTLDVLDKNDPLPQNRPPEKPFNPQLDYIETGTNKVYTCTLEYPETALDPDLDRISYRYRWYIDNTLYRDVISATLLDYFTPPLKNGEITCEVSTFDGEYYSESVHLKIFH